MECQKCFKNYTPNSCEEYFESTHCGDCRRINLRPPEGVDLWSKNVNLAKLWAKENLPLLPMDVHGGSNKKFYFNCKTCGELLFVTVANFSRKFATQQCNGCANISRGVKNSVGGGVMVADKLELLSIWHFEKNSNLDPSTVAINSNRKVWWLCERGHESYTYVYNRNNGRGCGKCMEKYFISRGEKEVLGFVKSIYGGEVLENIKRANYPYESDIYLPELSLIIDYNGDYWHSDKVIKNKKGVSAIAWHSLRKLNAEARGSSLTYVWECDWKNNRHEVEEALRRLIIFGEFTPILGIMSK